MTERNIGDVILKVDNISLSFGVMKVLDDISFDIRQGEIRSIIGPNGAGKSSMLSITFKGATRRQMAPQVAASQGIARTFQNIALFKGMSTLDNIMTGRNLTNLFWQALHIGPARTEELENREAAEKIIDFLDIQAIRKKPVGKLPYGLQKRVELGRALAAEPELLLLDEPMAGMNSEEKEDMCRFILDVNSEFGTTIALIEHDMGVVMDLSDRVLVLDYGKQLADDIPDKVRSNQDVIDAYLGVPHE
jgi:branched-chain amino acid transport system ATP-binding protein